MEHTAGFVIKRLMPYLGQSEAWWEKLLGVLAAGDRFIGVNRRHLRASDLGSALNCRMMGQTKTALEVDTTMRGLVFKGTSATGENAAVFPGKTWGDVLDRLIEHAPPLAGPPGKPATGEVPPGALPHVIELTIDIPLVTLIWHGPDDRPGRADWYGPAGAYSHTTMIARKTVVNGKIISALGDILRAPAAILGVAEQEPESEAATPVPRGAAAKTRTIARARSRASNNPVLAAGERERSISPMAVLAAPTRVTQGKKMSEPLSWYWTAQIPSELIREGYAEPETVPRYRRVYNAIIDGRIPAEQVNGRYRIARSTLPYIAALFGLNDHTSK